MLPIFINMLTLNGSDNDRFIAQVKKNGKLGEILCIKNESQTKKITKKINYKKSKKQNKKLNYKKYTKGKYENSDTDDSGTDNDFDSDVSDKSSSDEDFSEEEEDENDETTHVYLERGEKFIPLPNQFERESVFIAGPSGSGKSTYAAEYIKGYLDLFPGNDFYAFSRVDIKNDAAFDNLNPSQVMIDINLVKNPIDISKEINKPCIVLFDDITTIQDDKIRKAVEKIVADILEVGRKMKIYIIYTCHLIIGNERKLARTIMNEMTSLTVFPRSGAFQQISYAISTYFGIPKKEIQKYRNIDSRWITLFKNYPQFMLSEKECFILQ